MQARIGDRIAVESEKVGRPQREGVVLEVLEADFGTRYRVRWEDGHESVFHPIAGGMRIVSRAEVASSGG